MKKVSKKKIIKKVVKPKKKKVSKIDAALVKEAKKIAKVVNEKIDEHNKKVEDLKMKQERFCQLYATDADFFGNGVEAYLEVYAIDRSKPNWYKTACAAASRLLSNVKVCERINEIMVDCGFNDIAVDKQHAFLIAQHDDKHVKLGAIKEYNKLKQRIVEKVEIDIPNLIVDL
jgi:hypothetical protein